MYSAAVIGLGNIGMGYDYNCIDKNLITTHSSAFNYHAGFELVAAVDIDIEKQKQFKKKFDKVAYNSIKELFLHHSPEIIAIAVPTIYHYQVFEEIISNNVIAIILEKPISNNFELAENIVREAEDRKITILVNYMRRFEPGVQRIKDLILSGKMGEVYKGVVKYSKGILNNGSHFIDLLLFLLGKPSEIRIINKGRIWNDTDPEPDVYIKINNTEIYFLAGKEEYYSIAELELLGTKGRLLYKNGGSLIELNSCVSDPVYSGYTILSDSHSIIPNELNISQYHVINNLSNFLNRKSSHIASDGKSALETLSIVDEIIKQTRAL